MSLVAEVVTFVVNFVYRAYIRPLTHPVEFARNEARWGLTANVVILAVETFAIGAFLVTGSYVLAVLQAAWTVPSVLAVKLAWEDEKERDDEDDDLGGPWGWVG